MNDTMLRTLGVSLLLGGGCVEPRTSSTDADAGAMDTDSASSSTAAPPVGTETTTGSDDGSSSTSATTSSESSSSEVDGETSESSSTGAIARECDGVPQLLAAQGMIGASEEGLWGMQSWLADAPGYSCESADDFVVPAGTCWCITSVGVATVLPGDGVLDVQLDFYTDERGLPADDPWFSELATPTTVEEVHSDYPVARMQTIELSTPAVATAGRHWIAPKGAVATGDIYGLAVSLEDHANESTKIRWGTEVMPDCTEWDDVYVCSTWVPHEIELAFEIHGVAVDCE